MCVNAIRPLFLPQSTTAVLPLTQDLLSLLSGVCGHSPSHTYKHTHTRACTLVSHRHWRFFLFPFFISWPSVPSISLVNQTSCFAVIHFYTKHIVSHRISHIIFSLSPGIRGLISCERFPCVRALRDIAST